MGRHEAEAMGRQTDLVLDASLPKHKNIRLPPWPESIMCAWRSVNFFQYLFYIFFPISLYGSLVFLTMDRSLSLMLKLPSSAPALTLTYVGAMSVLFPNSKSNHQPDQKCTLHLQCKEQASKGRHHN